MVEGVLGKIVYHHSDILNRIKGMSREVHAHYERKGVDIIHAVRLLRGGKRFGGELVNELRALGRVHVELEDARVESYKKGESTGQVKVHFDVPDHYVEGHHLLVLDDIVDTALTATWVTENYHRRGAASVLFVPLIDKPNGRNGIDLTPSIFGFRYAGNAYLMGYGMQDNREERMDQIQEFHPAKKKNQEEKLI